MWWKRPAVWLAGTLVAATPFGFAGLIPLGPTMLIGGITLLGATLADPVLVGGETR